MACEYGYIDCKFEDTAKCDRCFTEGEYYKPKVRKKRKGLARVAQKADGRMGSEFEYANHKRNNVEMKEISSSMTLNSGATIFEKGDEHINGYVTVAQELKTQMPTRARGCKSFTIQREWLDKLHRESKGKQEFWHLVFAFSESEGTNPAGQVFTVVENDVFLRAIATMQHDRMIADLCDKRIAVIARQKDMIQAELNAAQAKIAYYEANKELMDAIKKQEEETNGQELTETAS